MARFICFTIRGSKVVYHLHQSPVGCWIKCFNDLKSFLTVWSLRKIRAAVVTSSSVGLTARSVKVRLQRERQVKHPEALTSLLLSSSLSLLMFEKT